MFPSGEGKKEFNAATDVTTPMTNRQTSEKKKVRGYGRKRQWPHRRHHLLYFILLKTHIYARGHQLKIKKSFLFDVAGPADAHSPSYKQTWGCRVLKQGTKESEKKPFFVITASARCRKKVKLSSHRFLLCFAQHGVNRKPAGHNTHRGQRPFALLEFCPASISSASNGTPAHTSSTCLFLFFFFYFKLLHGGIRGSTKTRDSNGDIHFLCLIVNLAKMAIDSSRYVEQYTINNNL